MNSRFLRWQLGVVVLLIVILLMEWGYSIHSNKALQELLDKTIETEYQADELPELESSKQTADAFAAINEKPLFIEGRKPLPEKAPDAPVAAETSQLEEWLLIGIYNNKSKLKVALFRKQNEAKKFLKLNQNQMISGWQLKEIQADHVVLEQGGQEKSVMLLKPRQQIKPPVPPAKPATPPGHAGQPQRQVPPAKATSPANSVSPPPVEPINNTSPENDSDES